MGYPWPSFGSFTFSREEVAHFGTDAGWVRQAHFNVQSPLGSAVDNVTTLALGSLGRGFEVDLLPARFDALAMLLNFTGVFTDWTRPTPDSRRALLTEVTSLEYLIRVNARNGRTERKIRAKVSFLSQ